MLLPVPGKVRLIGLAHNRGEPRTILELAELPMGLPGWLSSKVARLGYRFFQSEVR